MRASAELLEPEMIKGCYTLLLDDAPAVRHAAAELVNTFLAMQSKAKAMLHSECPRCADCIAKISIPRLLDFLIADRRPVYWIFRYKGAFD